MALLLLILSGCADTVSSRASNKAIEELAFLKVLENPTSFRGADVTWGGVIIKVSNSPGGSAIFLLETPPDSEGRPKGRGFDEGAFIARASEFLDPRIYTPGRKITVSGEVAGEELGSYHKSPYVYPVVKARDIHLWEKEIPPVQWDWGKIPYEWSDEFNPDELHGEPPLE